MSAVYGPQIFLMLARALARHAPAFDVQAALTEPTHKTHSRLLLADPHPMMLLTRIDVVALRCIKVNDQHL